MPSWLGRRNREGITAKLEIGHELRRQIADKQLISQISVRNLNHVAKGNLCARPRAEDDLTQIIDRSRCFEVCRAGTAL